MDNLVLFNTLVQPRLFLTLAFGFPTGPIGFLVRRFVDLGSVVEGQERVAVVAGDRMPVFFDEARATLRANEARVDGAVDVVSVAE